ncbi:hypothetical protein AWENTII_007321 [Aspergillus wentii]
MEQANHVKKVLNQNKLALGVWQLLPGSNLARTLARSGYDWVLVDCEHGNIDDAAMHESVAAISSYGVSPIVRIPDFQSWMVKRTPPSYLYSGPCLTRVGALDSGAHGVLAPLIHTVNDAKSFIEASKFPPHGKRGFGSPFSMDRFSIGLTATEYLDQANDNILLAVQIETAQALASVDEIAAIDGLDLLFVGPFDLGNGIGYPVREKGIEPPLEEAIRRIMNAAHAARKKAGIYCGNGQQAKYYADMGFDLVNVATDVGALSAHLGGELAIVRQSEANKVGGPYG